MKTNPISKTQNPKVWNPSYLVRLVLPALLVLIPTPSQALFTKLGMAGAQFLKIGVGRPTGMGDAFVAIADDASATYWNPAGAALIPKNEIMANYIDWISDVRLEYVALVTPTPAGSFGFAVTALNMGDIEETTIDSAQGTGRFFTASDMALGVTYARRFTDKFSFGVSAKVLQEQIWDMTAAGAAFDFGVYYNAGINNLRLAMAISNFGPDLKFGGGRLQFAYDPNYPVPAEYVCETYSLPVTFRFGAAYDILSQKNARLTAAADLVHFNDVNEKVNIGLETELWGLRLRGGYVFNTDMDYGKSVGYATGLSAGAGVSVSPFARSQIGVDYNVRNLGRLGVSHRVNLNIRF